MYSQSDKRIRMICRMWFYYNSAGKWEGNGEWNWYVSYIRFRQHVYTYPSTCIYDSANMYIRFHQHVYTFPPTLQSSFPTPTIILPDTYYRPWKNPITSRLFEHDGTIVRSCSNHCSIMFEQRTGYRGWKSLKEGRKWKEERGMKKGE